MLLTMETDYALRMLRCLSDGKKYSMGDIVKREFIPKQFAYKVLGKISRAGLVRVSRGTNGGYRLARELSEISLYDLMCIVEQNKQLISCMDPDYECQFRRTNGYCRVHNNLAVIEKKIEDSLKTYMIRDILNNRII